MIRHGDDICLRQLGGFDDFFEVAIRDLIKALEIFRVTLAFGGVLESQLARVDNVNSWPASSVCT